MILSALASIAALAPTLQTGAPCYLQQQPVKLAGAGFTPGASYSVMLDGTAVGSGTAAADGKLAGTLSSGALPQGERQARRLIAVHEGTLDARAAFDVSAFGAGFTPATGDPRTLSVRFSVTGIGVGAPNPARVWVHYVDPRRHLLRTLTLGTTKGPCGSLASSRRVRLFPFRRVRAGRWTLQFDLRRAYSSTTQPRITRLVAVK